MVYGKSRGTFIDKANELLVWISTWRDGVESRPIVFLGHSMGGLLIKQALINAHNNPEYIPIKDATAGLAFFATPHHGGDGMLVSLGGLAAKIAIALGFQKGDDVLETLKDGGMFSDFMQEHWRHQLEEYQIVSFWGKLDSVSLLTRKKSRACINDRIADRTKGELAAQSARRSREHRAIERRPQRSVQVWGDSNGSRQFDAGAKICQEAIRECSQV